MVKTILVLFWTDSYQFGVLWTKSGFKNDEIGALMIILGYISIHYARKKYCIHKKYAEGYVMLYIG